MDVFNQLMMDIVEGELVRKLNHTLFPKNT